MAACLRFLRVCLLGFLAAAKVAPFWVTRKDLGKICDYLQLLERAELIGSLRAASKGVSALQKPDKLFLDNTNLLYALAPEQVNMGTLRETFFLNQLRPLTGQGPLPAKVQLPKQGDFLFVTASESYLFEIGGPQKSAAQIGSAESAFVVTDTTQSAHPRRVPLWMFGLLY